MLDNNSNSSMNVQMFRVEPRKQLETCPSQTQFLPFRLRDIRDRKNPDAGPAPPGNLRSTSPISWASSVPGRSISLVILLTTSSVNTSGFSCRSFSTKVRIEDNGLTLKGRVIADNKIADSFHWKNNETEESLRGSFLYTFHSPQQHNHSFFLWAYLHIPVFLKPNT